MNYALADDAAHSFQQLNESPKGFLLSERAIYFECVFEGASVAKFCDDVAERFILYDFDSSEDVSVINAHDGYFFHIQQVFGDFIVNGFEVDDFDCDWCLIGECIACM